MDVIWGMDRWMLFGEWMDGCGLGNGWIIVVLRMMDGFGLENEWMDVVWGGWVDVVWRMDGWIWFGEWM